MMLKVITAVLVIVLVGFALFTLRDARNGMTVLNKMMEKWSDKRKYEPTEKPQVLLQWGNSEKITVNLDKRFGIRQPIFYVVGNTEGKADIPIDFPGLLSRHAVIELIENGEDDYYVFRNLGGNGNGFKKLQNGSWTSMRRGEEVRLNPDGKAVVFAFGSDRNKALKIILTVPKTWGSMGETTRRLIEEEKVKETKTFDETDFDL